MIKENLEKGLFPVQNFRIQQKYGNFRFFLLGTRFNDLVEPFFNHFSSAWISTQENLVELRLHGLATSHY